MVTLYLSVFYKLRIFLKENKPGNIFTFVLICSSLQIIAFFHISIIQILSLEDVERIMEETQEGIEKQRVSPSTSQMVISLSYEGNLQCAIIFFFFFFHLYAV